MEASAVYTIWLRELKRYLRSKSRMLGSLGMPIMFLAFMGTGLNSSISMPGFDAQYMDFMAPGIIGMVILFASMISGVSVLWDKQFGFMKEMLVAPISRTSIVLGKTLGGMTTALLQGIIMLIASAALGVSLPNIGALALMLVLMAVLSAGLVALGIAFASKMEDPHGFQLVMNFVMMPMFFLSGALFPLSGLPGWLKILTLLNPLTYAVDGLRGLWIGIMQFPLWVDFAVPLLFTIFAVYLGSVLFKQMTI